MAENTLANEKRSMPTDVSTISNPWLCQPLLLNQWGEGEREFAVKLE